MTLCSCYGKLTHNVLTLGEVQILREESVNVYLIFFAEF